MSAFVELAKRGGNEALRINPPTGTDFHITNHGSDWMFASFCVFMAIAIIYTLLMFKRAHNERFLHYTTIAPTLFMSIAYFTIASNLGWSPVRAKYNHVTRGKTDFESGPGIRQIFYARYIGWFMAFPWVIIQFSLIGDTPLWHTVFNCGLAATFSVCYLISSQIHSTYKWGYFVFGTWAAVVCCWSIMTTTRKQVIQKMKSSKLAFSILFYSFMPIWLVGYPVCYALSDGGNVLQPDSALVYFGIIDLICLGFIPALFVPLAFYMGLDSTGFPSAPHDLEKSGSMNVSPSSAKLNSPSPSSSSDTPVVEEKKDKKGKKGLFKTNKK